MRHGLNYEVHDFGTLQCTWLQELHLTAQDGNRFSLALELGGECFTCCHISQMPIASLISQGSVVAISRQPC